MEDRILLAIVDRINRMSQARYQEFLVKQGVFTLDYLNHPTFGETYGIGGKKDFILSTLNYGLNRGIIQVLEDNGLVPFELREELIELGHITDEESEEGAKVKGAIDTDIENTNQGKASAHLPEKTRFSRMQLVEGDRSVQIQGDHNVVFQGGAQEAHIQSSSSDGINWTKWGTILTGVGIVVALLIYQWSRPDEHPEGTEIPTATTTAETTAALEVSLPSPENKWIAFAAWTNSIETEIFIWDQENDPIQLTSNIVEDAQPAMSPDGTRVIYASLRQGTWDLYLEVIGSLDPPEKLTEEGNNRMPVWSADGTMIAYVSDAQGGDDDIFIMSLSNRFSENLTEDSSADDISPTWSPDSSKIAFASFRDGNFWGWEIYVIKVDNPTEIDRITNNSADDLNPSWAPFTDRNVIAFDTNRDDFDYEDCDFSICDWNIYLMDAAGLNQDAIVDSKYPENDPTW